MAPNDSVQTARKRIRTLMAVFIAFDAMVAGWITYRLVSPASTLPSVSTAVETSVDRYVRNATWETGFLKNSPYRKGDLLEILYFFESDSPFRIRPDFFRLESFLEIEGVEIDGKPVSKESATGYRLEKSGTLKIR